MPIDPKMITDIIVMTGVTILAYLFARSNDEINRKEGIIFVILLIIYMTYIIIRN